MSYYCNNFQSTNNKREYEKHVLNDNSKPVYPSKLFQDMWRRINKLDIESNKIWDNENDDSIFIAIDSNGNKVTNRGQ